ncbi:MAG: methionyl-tRNA formyltransferase [Halioglobus sp.]
MTSSLRVIFAGTPGFAAEHLSKLLTSKHTLLAVLTQPDRPAGRGKKLQPSPVKVLAESAGIPVLQPASLKDQIEQQKLKALNADVLIVVAYGLILPQAVLDIPRLGCINVHASLLPRWRGAAPIQRAIASGDANTGVTIMQMDAGLDTGDMLADQTIPIHSNATAASLHDELAAGGSELLLKVLADLPAHQGNARKQADAGTSYAQKILKAEAEIDWTADAAALGRLVRAFNPFPVCFTTLGPDRLKIWAATVLPDAELGQSPGTIAQADKEGIVVSCGSGGLRITSLQLPGGKVLSAEQMLNAKSALFAAGTALGAK